MSAKDIQFLFTLRNQIKLFHWQTTSYAKHKATDMLIENLDKNIDRYVEVYMGKYGRPRVRGDNGTITLKNMNEMQMLKTIRSAAAILMNSFTPAKDTDLLTIRDEMLADLNQIVYLFTLH
jgi:hypothetical protein